MTDSRVASRKLEHIRAIAADKDVERGNSGFDQIKLSHRALPELDLADVDTRVDFLGKPLSFPLLISSMTGGTGNQINVINRNLAAAAEETGVALALGSQRVMFTNEDARQSFALRDVAPSIPIIGNIGAVQLNYGFGIKECRAAVEAAQADGLYLHLNPLQELIQPEGDVNFSDLVRQIGEIVAELPVPVLLKEIGCGLSATDIQRAYDVGLRHFDVAGRGGTSWSRIEHHRRENESDDLGLLFQDWGLTTVEALCDAHDYLKEQNDPSTLIASGGIRNGIDMVKSLILGADLCGLAAPFLRAAQTSTEAVVAEIEKLRREFQTAMFLLGCPDIASLRCNSALLRTQGTLL